jgi:hypothetical protein
MAQAADDIHFSTTRVMDGEPVTLYIRGEGIEKDFTPKVVAQLKRHFLIFKVEGDEDRVRVVLYPLLSDTERLQGKRFTFPAIQSGRVQLAPTEFQVRPNPHVSVKWKLSHAEPFEGETLQWQSVVAMDDPTYLARLHVVEAEEEDERPQFDRPGYQLLAQAKPVAERPAQQAPYKVERLFYAAYTLKKSGKIRLAMPYLTVKNRGQRRWYFFAYRDRHQTFHVKPLPSYLPVNLPEGRLVLQSDPLPNWVASGTLVTWKIHLIGQGLPVYQLPSMNGQLGGGQGLNWLAPSIEKSAVFTVDGLQSRAEIVQPIRVTDGGRVTLPAIKLNSFNPVTGKLEEAQLPAQTLWVVPMVLINLMTVLGILLGLGLFAFGIWGFALQQQRKRALYRMKNGQTLPQIEQALEAWMAFVLKEKLTKPIFTGRPPEWSLQRYHQRLNWQGPQAINLAKRLAEALNQAQFAPASESQTPEKIKQQVQSALYSWLAPQTLWQIMKWHWKQGFQRFWEKRL